MRRPINTLVSRETTEQLERFSALLTEAAETQNLVAASTLPLLWTRHIEDSLQIIEHGQSGEWLDIGSGAGLPGIVIAIATGDPVTLAEPRRKRAEFLQRVADSLGLSAIRVHAGRVQSLPPAAFKNITARAVAPLSTLFEWSLPYSSPKTRWILPKGRSAADELASAETAWQGRFRLERSRTDGDAALVVAEAVRRRAGA